MKNHFSSSSDSLSALISISPPTEEEGSPRVYSREFQAMLDSFEEDDYREETFHSSEKKRRLSFNQVKALEMNFEVENKLEPDRKAKLAEELGLQPRQVAIWFQNRRARWKTKILDKDYGLLKHDYDALKHDYNNLQLENQALTHKLKDLKSKTRDYDIEEESNAMDQIKSSLHNNNVASIPPMVSPTDSSSSSALPSTENCTTATWSYPHPVMEWFHHNLSNSRVNVINNNPSQMAVKLEEQSFFEAEESCNFFSVDQPPTLQCYFTDE